MRIPTQAVYGSERDVPFSEPEILPASRFKYHPAVGWESRLAEADEVVIFTANPFEMCPSGTHDGLRDGAQSSHAGLRYGYCTVADWTGAGNELPR